MSKPRKAQPDVTFHPVAEMFPLMEGVEFEDLVEDIRKHGQRHAILVTANQIIDGRNRYRACLQLGIKPLFEEWDGQGSLTELSCSLNLHRRHLSTTQRSAAAAIATDGFEAEAGERMKKGKADPAAKSQQGRAAEMAARVCGVSARSVYDARLVRKHSPELFSGMLAGTVKLSVATRSIHREVKRQTLAKRPASAPTTGKWELITGDNAKVLPTLERRRFRLVFADPQYNIGIDYGKGSKSDQLPQLAYLQRCSEWMQQCAELLTPDGSMWVVISDENAAELCLILKNFLHMRGWIKWYETFGVNCTNSFNRTSRHLLYFVKNPARFVFNREAFTRPSARQTVYKDKRAAAGGKLWDDVWQIPRLVDNARERLPNFPTQLPLALVRPIVEGCSEVGDEVLDPFNGSGTTGEACVLSGRKYMGIDILPANVQLASQRLHAAEAGERPACLAQSNARIPFLADSQTLREAISEKRQDRKLLASYVDRRPRIAEDMPDRMLRAAATKARRAIAANTKPPPPGPTLQPVRHAIEGQLPAIRRAVESRQHRVAVGAEMSSRFVGPEVSSAAADEVTEAGPSFRELMAAREAQPGNDDE